MALQRVQMLLDPEQRRKLVELTRAQGKSISQITRQAIDAGLEQLVRDEQQMRLKQALEVARQLRESMPILDVDIVAEIRHIREARDEELLRRG